MSRVSSPVASQAVRLWLLIVAALLIVMVLVGGATRLTGSGLSIVEWRPVTGTLPPRSEREWQSEFEKYQAIPQYQDRNRGMSLQEFKTIYWWEWTHRLLGRVIGAVFLLPFLWFLWKGLIAPNLRLRLWLIFGLGALQGAVGWWMVASGLAGRLSVSQYRLAFHLTLACAIYAAVVWTLLELTRFSSLRGSGAGEAIHDARDRSWIASPSARNDGGTSLRGGEADEAIQGARDRGWIASSSARNDNAGFAPARVRGAAFGLLLLIFAQIYLGALVAGLHAGLIYNTWPLIDGGLVPSLERLMLLTPAWRNLFENVLTVQFAHRMVAYLLWTASIVHALDVARTDRRGPEFLGAVLLAVAVTVQAVLGILTLLHQVPIGLALAHQGMAMVVLTIAVVHAARSQGLRPAILGWRSDPGLVRRSRIMPPATPGPGRR